MTLSHPCTCPDRPPLGATTSSRLDRLAHTVAALDPDAATDRRLAAAIVAELEAAADAGLGPAGPDEPLVALQRRVGRALRRLARQPPPGDATTHPRRQALADRPR